MAIDILNERRFTITGASKLLGISAGCCWRWVLYGVKDGIKLESALIGGKRYTTIEAIERFIARINAEPGTIPSSRTAKQKERDIAAAEREVVATGS